MEQADSISLNASIELDPLRSSEKVEVFEVKYDSLDGLRIAGWYCLPKERSKPLPARVFYPGYISFKKENQTLALISLITNPTFLMSGVYMPISFD